MITGDPMRTPHLQAGLVGLVATLALLAGCAGGQGPLMGSREGGAASTICAPMRPSARVYYGAPMRNEGTRAITVDRVVVTDATNVADIDLGFDHDGYTIGTAAFLTGLGELDIRPMLDSLRDTSGDVIAPGEAVTLVLSPVPEVDGAEVVIREIIIHYRANGWRYTETERITFELAPDRCT